MTNSAVLNTVNNFIDYDGDNFAIGTIKLDNTDNKFFVDADLRGTPVIDEIGGVVEGGKLKLSVNIIAADTDAIAAALDTVDTSDDKALGGSMRLFANCSTIIEGSETQYGGYRYSFSQDPNDKGIINYAVVKDRSISLQDALQDITAESYEMPDLYVADSSLGQLYHFDPEPPHDFVERTFTIKGNNGILMPDGVEEREGISIPMQLNPPEEDSLTPHLIVKDMEAYTGFVRRGTDDNNSGQGGAILAYDSVLNIDNVAFIANTATGTEGSTMTTQGMGGALFIATRDGYEEEQGIQGDHFVSTINNSSFINNKAVTYGTHSMIVDGGGAIFSKGDLNITDSLFSGNSAISNVSGGIAEGGALYATHNTKDPEMSQGSINGDVSISGSMFIGNTAGDVLNNGALISTEGLGGAIDASRVNLTVTNSSFINNTARAAQITNEYTTVKGTAQGGALYYDKVLANGTFGVNITGSTFALNKTEAVKSVDNGDGTYTLTTDGVDQQSAYGGAIAFMPPNAANKLTVNISGSDFISNQSGYGGAIYNNGAELNITNSTFNGNKAVHYYIDSDSVHYNSELQPSMFDPVESDAMDFDFISLDDTELDEAGLDALGLDSSIWNQDMTGGAIYNYGELKLDGTTFTGNYAKQIAGAIANTVKNDIRNDRYLYFIGNASTLDGGIAGSGRTYFNLGLDKDGNPVAGANTTMTIGENTNITQGLIQVNSGTVNIADANNITARMGMVIGNGATLNVDKGQFTINNKYVREFENNGTVNILHNSEGTHGVLDFIADNVTFTNNGTLTSGGLLTRDIAGDGTEADACKLVLNDALDVQSDRTIAGTLGLNNKAVTMESETQSYNTLTVANLQGTGRFGIDANITNNGGVATASDQLLISDGTTNNANLILRFVNIENGIEENGTYTNYITFLDTTDAVGATLENITTYIGNLNNDGIATITSGGKQYKFSINETNRNKLDVTVGEVETTLAQFVQGEMAEPVATTYNFTDNVIVDENLGITTRTGTDSKDLYINLKGNELIALGDEVTGKPAFDGVTVDSGYELNVNGIAVNPADPDGTIRGFKNAFIVNGATIDNTDPENPVVTTPTGVLNVTDVTFTGNDKSIYNKAGVVNVKDSAFSGNTSSTEDGTIVNGTTTDNTAILNLNNVTFENNYRTNSAEELQKNDIANYGTLNFVGEGSTLDGGVFGYYNGTTNFMLDNGNSMDIGSGTYISQKNINIAEGTTLNAESAFSLTPYDTLTNNGNLNIEDGWLLPSDIEDGNKYVNNGTMTLGSDDGDVELLHTQLINNGTITGKTDNNKLISSSSTITNNTDATIDMDIANTPFAAGTLTEADLEAYAEGNLDEVNDAELIALIENSGYGDAIDAGTIDTENLGSSVFGNLINYGTITGNIGNKYGAIYNNFGPDKNNKIGTGTIEGNIDNKDGYLENHGTITGNITDNRDGIVSNAIGGVINGNIGDTVNKTTDGGEVYNNGTINGDVLTNTTSGFHIAKLYNNANGVINGKVDVLGEKSIASNNGTIDATNAPEGEQLVTNEGTFTNNGTIKAGLDNKGTFYNTVNGDLDATDTDTDSNFINNEAGAVLVNAGNMTAAAIINDGNMYNGVDPNDPEDQILEAAFFGDITNGEDGVFYNAGTVNGDVENGYEDGDDIITGGQVTNDGVINGDTENYGGTVVNNGTMNGYADNYNGYDTVNEEVITGQFVNNGTVDTSATPAQYIDNEGHYVNKGTIIGGLDNDGQFFNEGIFDSTDTDGDIDNDGLIVNTGNMTTAYVLNDGTVVNGLNPADPDSVNPTATINADIINSEGSSIVNAGDITGNIYNAPYDEEEESPAYVYLYNGGTVNGNIEGIEGASDGILILAGGDGTVNGDVNVEGLGLVIEPEIGTPLGELHITGNVNTDSFYADGGTLNLQNDDAAVANLGDITLTDNVNFKVDADLNNGIVDAISGTFNEEDSNPNAKINIAGMNILDNGKKAGRKTLDLFADEESRESLKGHLSASKNLNVTQPIFIYNGAYNSDTGKLRVEKTFNPAVLASSVAAQLGAYASQLNSYDQAFSNMDTYMLMPSQERTAIKFRNKIASTRGDIAFDPTNSPNSTASGWFRPFTSYEKTNLHNGPRVESTTYGSYFGGDSSLKDLGHGWDGMWGAYVGYNGSHQSYTNTGIYQNGGTLGLVGMAFKDNFFVGGTVNTGASAGEASTMYGNDNFTMLMAGAALRTGYNWELAGGKFIIQPSLQTSYSFVNTFDYTNAAGVKIDSDPLHAITVEPGLKFIGNLKHGWQPYAGVSLVYTVMDKADVKANDVALPNISINPYVKYGLGVRKTWGDRLSGFLQTFFMSGGRSGIGVQAGFRFAIGKEGANNISGKTPELKPAKVSLNNIK